MANKVEEAREALEKRLPSKIVQRIMEFAYAYGAARELKGHVEACHYEEFVDEEWQECGQEGALCERGKQLEEAMKS